MWKCLQQLCDVEVGCSSSASSKDLELSGAPWVLSRNMTRIADLPRKGQHGAGATMTFRLDWQVVSFAAWWLLHQMGRGSALSLLRSSTFAAKGPNLKNLHRYDNVLS
ncbi:hypothetical protein GOP47_0009659 [Adiantum capillus-veneris]|uniref:Uncharacterized protein n=1 Tax=Adiantum capillus-veneris TaxID=13818 RepID=A0A9D4UWZ5_ADICA|nr:hypothetical protein GOP47_0009659 [Adiantum capillus-veneris]